MVRFIKRAADMDRFHRRRGAFVGFAAGVAVPLILSLLVVVSMRGYGIADTPPVPPQIYTAF